MRSVIVHVLLFITGWVDCLLRTMLWCFHKARALAFCGRTHVCYVAAVDGRPVIGNPRDGQLHIAEAIDANGTCYRALRDDESGMDIDQIYRDRLQAETYILEAMLTVRLHGGETHVSDMTHLMYTLPFGVSFTPENIVALMFGMRVWQQLSDADLTVITMDGITHRFYTEHEVDRATFFSSDGCNGHEAHARSAGFSGSNSGCLIHRDDAASA